MDPAHEPDEDLLQRFVAGERAALGELARRYEPLLLGLCRGMLRGRSDLAMDAVQEVWVRVIRFGAGFDGRSRFRTWLYRIAVNQCRTLAQRAGAGARTVAGEAAAGDAAPPGESGFSERVREAVSDLSPAQQEVLLLCYHGGLTHEQVADVLEVPLGTVKSRLHAALGSLRKGLGQEVAS